MPATSATVETTSDLASRLRVAAARLARTLRHQAADPNAPVTASQIGALATINREGPIALGELAAAEHVQPPSMTRIVDRLQELGLARRDVDPDDRRVARASITDEGRRYLAKSRTRKDAFLSRRIDRLDSHDRLQLAAGLAILERLLEDDT